MYNGNVDINIFAKQKQGGADYGKGAVCEGRGGRQGAGDFQALW